MFTFNKRFVLFILSSCLLSFTHSSAQSSVKHVILISIDGFRPEMYQDKSWPTPNMQFLMQQGTYAKHLKSVFPAYTYPSHTAMVTGALPARSGICYNQPKNSKGEWNWFMDSIKVPTIWQILKKAGMTTASVEWPPSVGKDITWDVPEIWDVKGDGSDRITEARKYATPGLIEEVEQNATGKLDSMSMNEEYLSLDEQAARAAGYIFKTHKPTFLAVHFACVDGMQHEYGRDHDSVRLAVACNDHAIGDILEAIQKSGLKESTTVIIVGDHGFSTIHEAFRPNILIKDIDARFIAAGGSAFLYRGSKSTATDDANLIKAVTEKLNTLPKEKRKLFRIIDRKELDQMGADSAVLIALSAEPGLVFSGSTKPAQVVNHGPGTLIQQNVLEGVFYPVSGGHHGYDPNNPQMYTGFIAVGAGIRKGGVIPELCETDISPLIAELLGVEFKTPDGKLIPGIISAK